MGYFFSISKSATEVWLNAFEGLLLACGLVLAFGAAGEYLEDHDRLPNWMKWSRNPKLFFVWMVAISLFGEFAGDAGVFLFSGHLQTINDGEYAALNKEAGLARKYAADTNERAGKLEVQAASLRKRAEDEAVARLKIEQDLKKQRPRIFLLSENKDAFIKTMRPYAGQRIIVLECGRFGTVPPEQLGLLGAVETYLRIPDGAGWIVDAKSWDACAPAAISIGGGNRVWLNSNSDPSTKVAGKALASELTKLFVWTTAIETPTLFCAVNPTFCPAGSPDRLAIDNPMSVILSVGSQ